MDTNGTGSRLRKMVFTAYFHADYVHTYALEGKFWATEVGDLQDMTLRTRLYSQSTHPD